MENTTTTPFVVSGIHSYDLRAKVLQFLRFHGMPGNLTVKMRMEFEPGPSAVVLKQNHTSETDQAALLETPVATWLTSWFGRSHIVLTCFRNHPEYGTMRELLSAEPAQLLKVEKFGARSLASLRRAVELEGLTLNMCFDVPASDKEIFIGSQAEWVHHLLFFIKSGSLNYEVGRSIRKEMPTTGDLMGNPLKAKRIIEDHSSEETADHHFAQFVKRFKQRRGINITL